MNAVLAACVVFVPGAAVGTVGMPVSAGLFRRTASDVRRRFIRSGRFTDDIAADLKLGL
jgi:hypothetical protein